jgi:hypothetical protein
VNTLLLADSGEESAVGDRHRHHQHPEGDDDDAGDPGQRSEVRAEELPESGRSRAERGEHDREAEDEQKDDPSHPSRRDLSLFQLCRRVARHHRQISGEEWQHTRGDERDDPGPEGDD